MVCKRGLIMSLEIEYRNRTNGNGHFFDVDTMRFFKSRIGAVCIKDGIWFFITSEKPPHGDRAYCVRRMELNGNINTIPVNGAKYGSSCSMTKYQANKLFKELTKQ
jgi:hypothetical protein